MADLVYNKYVLQKGKVVIMETLLAFVVPFCLSTVLIPLVKKVSIKTEAWAKQNERTIHHGIISRIGGIAIFVAFSVGLALFFKADRSIQGIYLASSLMFLIGLWDDFLDLPAKFKFLLQVGCAIILLVFGVRVDTLRVLGVPITNTAITSLFTILWVVGITNAINFLDGLDGLCGGMILVVLSVVCSISIVDQRGDIVLLSLIMMGSILGFLLYNSHPASIFMGDCGSLFLGCMIASISLLGFKSSTMMTLSFPILILILPIIDTFSAILRRKIKHIPFDQADRSHLHHQLMARFGQTTSVLIMCGITFGFGMSAFVYIHDRRAGMFLMLLLMGGVELFIERTGMISPSFHPIHSLFRWLFKPFLKNKPAWYDDEDELEVEVSQPKRKFIQSKQNQEYAKELEEKELSQQETQDQFETNSSSLTVDHAEGTSTDTSIESDWIAASTSSDYAPSAAPSSQNAENVEDYLASFTMTPEESIQLEQFKKRPASEFFSQSAFQADPKTILENMHLESNTNTNDETTKKVVFNKDIHLIQQANFHSDAKQNEKDTSLKPEVEAIKPRLFEFDENGILEEGIYEDNDSFNQESLSDQPLGIHDAIDRVGQSKKQNSAFQAKSDQITTDANQNAEPEEDVYPNALSAFSLNSSDSNN